MLRFIEQFKFQSESIPDRIFLSTYDGSQSYTFKEAWQISGKTVTYLRKKHLGKEDFILICMPRGIDAFAALLGVWKAGAAATMIDADAPVERIEFIKKDCQAKLVIDTEIWQEILAEPEFDSYIPTNSHDACFAIYTSGTTGYPKGVLHEYGQLENIMQTFLNTTYVPESDIPYKVAITVPTNYIAALQLFICGIILGTTLFIVPYDVSRDLNRFMKFISCQSISAVVFPPAFLRLCTSFPSCLKLVYLAGDTASGAFIEGPRVMNLYGSSESACVLTHFILDKAYDNPPVGKPTGNVKPFLLDEEDKPVAQGEQGEICFRNEYLRGYINLPEQTANVLKDGIFHTGDIGCFDENGNLCLCGRIDEMVKINGNRVEPEEVEKVIRDIFGVKNVIVKGFSENGNAFLALYYLKHECAAIFAEHTSSELNRRCKEKLPYYMLPKIYVSLDEFPVSQTGKIIRKKLPFPDLHIDSSDYQKPENKEEAYICAKMASCLNLDKVSRNDDFFDIGGDSLSLIRFISECPEIDISIRDVFEYRTPANIVEHLHAKEKNRADISRLNEQAIHTEHTLLPAQKLHVRMQESVHGTNMLNLAYLCRLKDDINPEKLASALSKAIRHHPGMNIRLFKRNGSWLEKYDESLLKQIDVIRLTADEFSVVKDHLVKPFSLEDGALYRAAVYLTEKGSYLYLDMSHIIMDGRSISILLRDIIGFYENERYIPSPDYFFGYLEKQRFYLNSSNCEEAKNWYKNHFKHSDYETDKDTYLRLDINSPEKQRVVKTRTLFLQEKHDTVFYLTAAALAVAKYNDSDRALIYFVYDSREDYSSMNCIGDMITPLPFFMEFGDEEQADALLARARERMSFIRSHYEYPFFEANAIPLENVARFILQKNIIPVSQMDMLIAENIDVESQIKTSIGICGVNLYEKDNGCLELVANFSESNISRPGMNTLLDYFADALQALGKTGKIPVSRVQ